MIIVNVPVLFVFIFWHFLLVLRVTFLVLFCSVVTLLTLHYSFSRALTSQQIKRSSSGRHSIHIMMLQLSYFSLSMV